MAAFTWLPVASKLDQAVSANAPAAPYLVLALHNITLENGSIKKSNHLPCVMATWRLNGQGFEKEHADMAKQEVESG